MKKIIVTTTINEPTEALKKFKDMYGWDLIVVGDLKTPHEAYKDYDYLSPEYQENTYKELSDAIGWNCIQRRNIGFVEAYKRGADIIATVDDDNIPYDGWGENLLIGKPQGLKTYYTTDSCFDPISVTNHFKIWHRGFPIQLLKNRNLRLKETFKVINCDIQADFWNGNPDIDAICRMEHKPNCLFKDDKFPFSSESYSPFNSQNTFITRRALEYYFMFPKIGRMDDIWASYYLEAMGFKVVYNKASVFQKRNDHNITKDFKDEILGYTKTLELLEDVPNNIKKFIPEESWKAFKIYQNLLRKVEK